MQARSGEPHVSLWIALYYRRLIRAQLIGSPAVDDPSLLLRLLDFVKVVLSGWFGVIGFILTCVEIGSLIFPQFREWLSRLFPTRWRRPLLLVFGVGLLFLAAFSAYDDVSLRLKEAGRISNTQNARIQVTRVAPIGEAPGPNPANYILEVYYRNNGKLPCSRPSGGVAMQITDKRLTAAEQDQLWSRAEGYVSAVRVDLGENQIETGQDKSWIFFGYKLPASQIARVEARQAYLYVALALKYTDQATPSDKAWLREFCGVLTGDLSTWNDCAKHNRIRLVSN